MVSNNFSPRKNLKTVWRNIAVAVFAVCFAVLGLCVTLIPSHATDDETFITIGEIYNNPTNMQKLYDALRGATSGTTYAQIATMAEQKTNAATIHELNAGRDIKVTFGGQEWHVCYLSTDTDGNPILTLLLTTPSNVARDFLYVNDQVIDVEYPSDLYGTSYVRVVGLNNGGEYLSAAETLTKVDPVVDHPLARYTVTDLQNSVTKVIVKPEKVAWQESGTPTMDRYRELNSQWGAESPTENWYDRYYELTQKYGYDAWKNDFLWLPSFYEMKKTEKDTQTLWRLSYQQKTFTTDIADWAWFRVGNGANMASLFSYSSVGIEEWSNCGKELGVRPAVHIDLSAPELAANLDEVPDAFGTVVYDGKDHHVAVTRPAWYREEMQIVYRRNGVVTDTVTTVGEYTAEITLGQLTKTVPLTIAPREVTWSGTVTPQNRVYKRECTVGLSTAVTLDNAVTGDNVKVTLSAVMADKNAGDDKPLTVTAVLSGDDKDNYLLTNAINTTDYTVNITPKTIVVKDITADSKVYDNTSRATLTISGAKLDNYILPGDDLTVAVTGTFTQVNVGTDIPVNLDIKLVGDDAGNYKIDLENSQKTAYGNITKRLLAVTINHQTVKVGDPLKALTARVTSGSLVDPADEVYELGIKTDPDVDVDHLPVGEYEITGKGINDNYDIDFVDGKYTVLTVEAWEALQTTEEKDGNNAWLIIVIVIAIAAFVGALVGVGLVIRSHDKNREPKPAKEPKPKKDKKTKAEQSEPAVDSKTTVK